MNKLPSFRPELVGQRFGSVEIVSPDTKRIQNKKWQSRVHVFVRCVTCLSEKWISLSNLKGGRTAGCRKCNQPVRFPKWLFARITGMKMRCENPKNPGFKDYGARGIQFNFETVSAGALWVQENLGIPEDRKLQLDRIDNDGHYEAGNLRWSTRQENLSHTRRRPILAMAHAFRERHPEIRYSDATLRNLIGMGLTDEQIVGRFHKPSYKPKGKYGTFSTPDPVIVSLLKGS